MTSAPAATALIAAAAARARQLGGCNAIVACALLVLGTATSSFAAGGAQRARLQVSAYVLPRCPATTEKVSLGVDASALQAPVGAATLARTASDCATAPVAMLTLGPTDGKQAGKSVGLKSAPAPTASPAAADAGLAASSILAVRTSAHAPSGVRVSASTVTSAPVRGSTLAPPAAKALTGSVTAVNHTAEPMLIQIEVMRLSHAESGYVRSDEVIVSPPIFDVRPGASQVVRVALRGAVDAEIEYRLFFREVRASVENGQERPPAASVPVMISALKGSYAKR